MIRYEVKEYYNSNINVKKDGIVEDWSEENILEYRKCMKDPVHFAKKYCKIISLDHGLVNFQLYPYQEQMFDNFAENRFNIVLACRQSGKSISVVCYLLWYAIFHPEKTVAVLANKGATSREMLGRITLMLENLPFFLQPGTRALNKGSIEFSNNSKIVAAATSGSSIRGMSISLLYADEFAFVENATEFYTSTYPVVTAGQTTKIIITSTANGIGNMFEELWTGAIQNTNEYVPFRVDWWDVPGRDEEWKKLTISNTSQLQFDQEFGNEFLGTGDTLIQGETLMRLKAIDPVFQEEKGDLLIYKPVVAEHEYIMTVDVAKGRGRDYSSFTIIDISVAPFEQVAVYRNNMISPILFPNVLERYGNIYNEAYIVIETNDAGSLVAHGLYYDLEYENMHVGSAIKNDDLGIQMNRKTKRIGCSSFKDILEGKNLKLHDKETIKEITTFISKGQSYEASPGCHDDLVMNLVLFGYFSVTEMFADMTDINLKEMIFKTKIAEIDADIPPWGFIDDGSHYIDEIEERERPSISFDTIPEWYE
jgi:hypothetical protein